jgi:hypothetical protein
LSTTVPHILLWLSIQVVAMNSWCLIVPDVAQLKVWVTMDQYGIFMPTFCVDSQFHQHETCGQRDGHELSIMSSLLAIHTKYS